MLSTTSDNFFAVGNFFVPLKCRCSRKCEMPLTRLPSYRLPAFTNIDIVTDSAVGIGTMSSVRPFLKTFLWYIIFSIPAKAGIHYFNLIYQTGLTRLGSFSQLAEFSIHVSILSGVFPAGVPNQILLWVQSKPGYDIDIA